MTLVADKKWSWAEFREMEFEDADLFIYELLEGMLVKRTAPSLPHQRVSRRLTFLLEKFLLEHPIGEFFPAPTDVAFDDHSGVVPDLSYVSNERNFILYRDDYIAGVPDVIFEIISPGTGRRDRVEKKELYEKFGLKEYWLVDPSNKTVEIFIMENNTLQRASFVELEEIATSTVISGFSVHLKDVF